MLREGKIRPDGCWICGRGWREHLEFWWELRQKRCREFDRVTDGSSLGLERNDGHNDWKEETKHESKDRFAFYRRYVDVADKNDKGMLVKREREVRTSIEGTVSYSVPPFNPLVTTREKRNAGSVLLLSLARTTALMGVEDLILYGRVDS